MDTILWTAGILTFAFVVAVIDARRRSGSVRALARRLDVPVDELVSFAPVYRRVAIAKRNGDYRRLLVPDKATKALQRRILRRLLGRLRAHPCATGFERGIGIVDNAARHVGQAVVVRMDVVDFFGTTTADRVTRYCRKIGWGRRATELLVRLCTHDEALPQGAPTSPRLSNLVNFRLDTQLDRFARRRRGVYTRYADDITLSFPKDYPRRVRGAIQHTARVLRCYGYRMHERRKLHVRRRHQRQIVTGLVVNDKVQLPRPTRRWLRAVAHRVEHGGDATLTPEQLQGWLGLLRMIRANGANGV